MIDFTHCEIDLTSDYGGSDKKIPIVYNNDKYMVKFSDKIPDEKRNSMNSSYTNSAYSEHIGCEILKTMGFNVQDTLLGTYSMTSSKGEKRVYPVVACKNFNVNGKSFIDFKKIEETFLFKTPKIPKIVDLYDIMNNGNKYFGKEFGKEALKAYWDLFIADGLISNFDRHANNWGYFIDNETKQAELAPIFDCGSSLFPQLADDVLSEILNNQKEIQKRVDVFPNAALQDVNGRKISYKEYISSHQNKDCNDALIRIYPKIDMDKIYKLIDNCNELSDIRKEFYKTILDARYQQIIKEPYIQLCDKFKEIQFSELKNLSKTEKELVHSIIFLNDDVKEIKENSLSDCVNLTDVDMSKMIYDYINENFGESFFAGTKIDVNNVHEYNQDQNKENDNIIVNEDNLIENEEYDDL